MEVDNSYDDDENNGNDSPMEENGHPRPVLPDSSGVGSPYAPENFPEPGDNWRWKVGKRVTGSGYYRDRYLYAPKRLKDLVRKNLGSKQGFPSKPALVRFIQAEFPDADVHAFFASFSWKVPSKAVDVFPNGKSGQQTYITLPLEESPEPCFSEPSPSGCKAHNRTCISLISKSEESTLALMPCDICCSEQGFCRECCCILCSKTVDSSHGGYSFIRCEALVGEDNSMCGHVAHLSCAVRAYTAGTIGGTIGLDVEYYCRRCDSRTELLYHVKKLFEICKSVDSRDEVEKILNVGVSVLYGSQKASAKLLLSSIYSVLSKLKHGDSLEEIWRDDNLALPISSNSSDPRVLRENGNPCREDSELADVTKQILELSKVSNSCRSHIHYQKLDNDISNVLQGMRRAQESDYRMVEEGLYTQRKYLKNLYEQVEHETSVLKEPNGTSTSTDYVSRRQDQIKREHEKLLEMLEVTKRFCRTSKKILREHFDSTSE